MEENRHIFKLHILHSTASNMGHIVPQEASRHMAGTDGFVPGPARAWWAWVGGSSMGGIPTPWFQYIGGKWGCGTSVAVTSPLLLLPHLKKRSTMKRAQFHWPVSWPALLLLCCGDAQETFRFSKQMWLVRRKEGVGSIYANPHFPASQAAVLPASAQWEYSQPQGGHLCIFVPQMNLDIKVLPLLMSTDVLFSVFTVLGNREIHMGCFFFPFP